MKAPIKDTKDTDVVSVSFSQIRPYHLFKIKKKKNYTKIKSRIIKTTTKVKSIKNEEIPMIPMIILIKMIIITIMMIMKICNRIKL